MTSTMRGTDPLSGDMNPHTHMGSKNVALRRDVYEALRREMRPGESFTTVALRLLNERGPLSDLAGTWSPVERSRMARWRRLRRGGEA